MKSEDQTKTSYLCGRDKEHVVFASKLNFKYFSQKGNACLINNEHASFRN